MTSLLALLAAEGEIVRINIDDKTPSSQVIHSGTGPVPDGIAVDGKSIYWTTMGFPAFNDDGTPTADFTAHNGTLNAAELGADGTVDPATISVLIDDKSADLTTGKQLVYSDGRLYWGNREGYTVSTIRPDGSDLRHLIVTDEADGILGQPVGVAVIDEHLYWTQKGPSNGGQGRIFRASLELPTGQDAGAREDIEVLFDHLPEPIDLATSGDYLYWSDRGAEPEGNTVNRALIPAPGRKGGEVEILAGGFTEAIGLAIDVERGVVYVADLGGRIHRVPLDGGEKELLIDLETPVTGIELIE